MNDIALLNSTGNAKIDEIIQGVIGLFEITFPERVRGYYLMGSYSDKSEIATSDLDLIAVFKDNLSDDEDEKVDRFCENCNRFCPVELDLNARSENDIPLVYAVLLKLAAIPLYGEDIREKISLPTVSEFARRVLHNALGISLRLRSWRRITRFPLDYPEPDSDFYGYATRRLLLGDGSERIGIKDMVVMAGWASTALVGLKTGQFVARKNESFNLYKTLVNDEWAGLLEEIDQRCRGEWNYLVPDAKEARADFKEICKKMLAFENYCFSVYEEVLLVDLANPAPKERLLAIQRAGYINYENKEIKNRLELLVAYPDTTVSQAAVESLEKLNGRV